MNWSRIWHAISPTVAVLCTIGAFAAASIWTGGSGL